MAETDSTPTVRDDAEHHRFVVEDDDALAELVYRSEPGRLVLVHTEVPASLGGRGIGATLVRAAIAEASSEGLTIVPWCPFARRWLHDHPDEAATVSIDWLTPRPTT